MAADLLIQRINNLERGQRTLLGHIAALLEVTDRMGDLLNALEALDDEATEYANARIGAAREVLTQCGVDGATPATTRVEECPNCEDNDAMEAKVRALLKAYGQEAALIECLPLDAAVARALSATPPVAAPAGVTEADALRRLLARYVKHIWDMEGIDYVDRDGMDDENAPWTDEDKAALRAALAAAIGAVAAEPETKP